MALVCRWILVCCLLLCAAPPRARASTPETRAFNAAANALRGALYERAEAQFADFVTQFPASPRVPEAILFQAEARLEQTNYAGAIELLSAALPKAGSWTDHYLFWLAETQLRQGDNAKARETFAKLVQDFPASSRRLEASIGQATACSRLGQWPCVLDLLQQPNGVFQTAIRTNASNELMVRGTLLLSEAQLVLNQFGAAEASLQPLAKFALNPRLDWQRQYLLCRILLASGRADTALQHSTNLLALATNAAQRTFLAESIAFQAGLFERLRRPVEAIATYQKNLADGVPAGPQRQALLKITDLSLAQNQIPQAAEMMEKFLAQGHAAPAADLAWLTLGELRLRQHVSGLETNCLAASPTNAPTVTNCLERALQAFQTFTNQFPQNPLLGKVQLDLGWCFWLTNRWPESQAAFQAAVQLLPLSNDLAIAYFKLADVQARQAQHMTDAQVRQTNYAAALGNYRAVIEKFEAMPEVRSNLFEPALYQSVRVALAAGDLPAATNAMAKLLAWFPTGFHTDRAALLAGQEISQRKDPAAAREILSNFIKAVPNAPLVPEMQLALARTYEQQEQWPKAIELYDNWVSTFTNHPAQPSAEYYRGWANFQARRDTNALSCFTNFIAHFPTNEFSPLAQWWVADYYFRQGSPADLKTAEMNYQLLALNWPGSKLAYQARMMAGRVAVKRQGWSDAMDYFKKLCTDSNCPPELGAQAWFALGDAFMSTVDTTETDKLANYGQAINAFEKIPLLYPTNQLAVLAWGEKALCHLQAAQFLEYERASNAFQQVIEAPITNGTARSIAKIGLGIVCEKQAQQKNGPEKVALLKLALNHYLDVFDEKILREGEKRDLFWTQKAGLEAARVAEALQEWSPALHIYQRLEELLPPLRPKLEKSILKAQEQLARQKT